MNISPIAVALTTLNIAALAVFAQTIAAGAQPDSAVLRGEVLELVDESGQVRSRLNVEEDGAVVLRMMDETGTIRLKLGAESDGSGLTLLDDQTEPGVQILAEPEGPMLKLFGGDDDDLLLTP